ncbi:MAG: Fe-S cluster protein [Thermoplasmata archaeon HGW-Thermoplasmata-1]|nr:MAG: Fe-S cluster protein [Thermoplasmata archaeon HGW-Thermoplasmata-1]
MDSKEEILEKLGGKDCGLCGVKTCEEFTELVLKSPDIIERCVFLKGQVVCDACVSQDSLGRDLYKGTIEEYKDSLDREYDFVLETFPNEPGPRETCLPDNPLLTRELEIKKGDIVFGRPQGLSCGCPVTHVGRVMEVDYKTGNFVWCVVGPLCSRYEENAKDIGYYTTKAYEGLVFNSRVKLEIGRRYYFLPRRCMLQWRHCGLLNFINKTENGVQVRIEGLWIG